MKPKSDVPAWQMLSVMDEASESLCVKKKMFVGGISTLSSDGDYFVCLFGTEENTEHYVLGQNTADHSMVLFSEVYR